MFSTFNFCVLQKQKKLTGMVHEMCSVISHAVGKLVTGIGRMDDDEWGTDRSLVRRQWMNQTQNTRWGRGH